MLNREELAVNLYNVLKTPEYEIQLTMYGKDGVVTTDPRVASWFYINPYDCMIRIPSEDQSIVKFWKNRDDINRKDILRLITRLKQCANIIGFTFNTKLFSRQKMVDAKKDVQDPNVIEETKFQIGDPIIEYINYINSIL